MIKIAYIRNEESQILRKMMFEYCVDVAYLHALMLITTGHVSGVSKQH